MNQAVRFFFETGAEMFVLLYFAVFAVSLFRQKLSPQKIEKHLSGKNRIRGYFLAIALGAVTPFCTCSAVPLFLALMGAGVPFGVCMAFIMASSVINEIAAFLLIGLAGIKAALAYVLGGVLIAFVGACLADRIHRKKPRAAGVRYHEHHHSHAREDCCCSAHGAKMPLWRYAHGMAMDTIKETWGYVVAGLIFGALLQGFMPDSLLSENLSVPLASLVGTLLYAPHGAIVPIFDSMLQKGVPLGTAITLLMGATAISLPELAMMKKVLSVRLLVLFIIYLLFSFTLIGYILNYMSS